MTNVGVISPLSCYDDDFDNIMVIRFPVKVVSMNAVKSVFLHKLV